MNTTQIGIQVIKKYVKTLGSQPGVYQMLNDKNEVLYVGKAKNLKNRVTSYTRLQGHTNRIQRMIAETRTMDFSLTHTEAEALLLEANLIKKHRPPYNILMRDDKSFAYILLRKDHPIPQLTKHRGAKSKVGEYYGPFASASAVNETLTTLHKVFKLRSCTDSFFATRKRPCLQYHIKRCSAPCVQYISSEDYQKAVQQARDFLRGKSSDIQKQLAAEMRHASAARQYERAAVYRDRIHALTKIQSQQRIHLSHGEDLDVIAAYQTGGETCIQVFFYRGGNNYGNHAFFPKHDKEEFTETVLEAFLKQFYISHEPPKEIYVSHSLESFSLFQEAFSSRSGHKVTLSCPARGLKKSLVERASQNAVEALSRKFTTTASHKTLMQGVRDAFGLPKTPHRIEVYDNSHISGTSAVGAMIVCGLEGFDKKSYRTFTIKSQELTPGDDYGMLSEVLTRRFKGSLSKDTPRPDLLLIDGGAGQLSAAIKVLRDFNSEEIPIVAIAKGPHRNAGQETFYMEGRDPFQLEFNDPLLYFLQRLRDEAHRFAIGTHRAKRQKKITKSSLDDIPGVGAKRKKALLQRFGSAKAVERASINDLKAVEGIDDVIAQTIYDYYRS